MTASVCHELGLEFIREYAIPVLETMQGSVVRREIDGLIRLNDSRKTSIAVEVKRSVSLQRTAGSAHISHSIRIMEAADPSFGGLLLITEATAATSFVSRMMPFDTKFRAVVIRDNDDRGRLKGAIKMMIELVGKTS